jgi:hypothetical protein
MSGSGSRTTESHRGIVVAGCSACKNRLQSMNEFLRHLAEDAMLPLLGRLSSEITVKRVRNNTDVAL